MHLVHKAFPPVALCVAVVVTVSHMLYLDPWMLDDSYIFFRYAENWVAGHGPVYNAGEAPVEGYTSFLWMAILTLGHLVGGDTVALSKLFGYAATLTCLLIVHQSYRWLAEVDRDTSALSALFLGTCGVFTPWGQSGMETSLHTLLLTCCVIFHLRAKESGYRRGDWWLSGLFCALAALNRLDALLPIGLIMVDSVLQQRRAAHKGLRGGRGPLILLGVFLLVFVPYFLWRWSYYGYLLPNTFYVKVGATWDQFSRGLVYLGKFLAPAAPFLLLLLLVGWRGWRNVNRNYLIIPAILLVHVAYIVIVGGDVMPAFRFFTPIMPLLCILAAMAMRVRITGPRFVPTACGVAFYSLLIMCFYPCITRDIVRDDVAFMGRISGTWLKENAPKDSVVATNTAGTVVYYSGLKAIDMLGLNDVHIAHVDVKGFGSGYAGHEKGDGKYVFERKPEFIQFGASLGWHEPVFPGDHQIAAQPGFHQQYELEVIKRHIPLPSGRSVPGFAFFVRKDIKEKLNR